MSTYFLSIFKIFSKNDGGSLVAVLIFAVIGSMMFSALSYNSRSTIKNSGKHMSKVSSLTIAEAGKERVIADLRERIVNLSQNKQATIYNNESFGDGAYTVQCLTAVTDTATITSTGVYRNDTSKIEVIARIQPDGWQRWIKGAVTARTSVSTLGSIEIDGRDYDTNSMFGTYMGLGGVVGIAAGGTVSVGGSSRVGGNFTAPQNTIISGQTVEQNIDTNGYPQTPEELLGITTAQLETYRRTSAPPTNFVGIVYAEEPYDFAGGILIVHNSTGTASLGNYHNHFKGLIIADEVKHFNGGSSVLGAVFMLGKTTGGNCFGNGAARIHYSSQMIEKVMKYIPASGRRNVEVLSWREKN
jgi:hypothetical protein